MQQGVLPGWECYCFARADERDLVSTMESPTTTGGVGPSQDKTTQVVSEYFKERTQQWRAIYERKRPLTLLELPVDILQLIVKEACGPCPIVHSFE